MGGEWEEKRNKILQVRLNSQEVCEKKKMTNAISGGSESATRSEILIHEGYIFTGIKPRNESQKRDHTALGTI